MKWCVMAGVAALAMFGGTRAFAHGNEHTNASTGVLVVTADRGFLGNVEIGDGFDLFDKGRNAEILYVSDARSKTILEKRLTALQDNGAERIITLPLFISSVDARWQMAQDWLQEYADKGLDIQIAPLYGTSYLAVEDLSDRLREAHTDKTKLLVVGYGATDAKSVKQMKAELQHLAGFASSVSADDIQVIIAPTWSTDDREALQKQYTDAVKKSKGLIVPVLLANKADSMMSFVSGLQRIVHKDAQLVTSNFASAQDLQQWFEYATNKVLLRSSGAMQGKIGVIALAHGADWFWNQTIRDSLATVAKKYPVAFTFSMGDQPTIERAVRELEKQNVRGIVLVRIFGQAYSFRSGIERMIGADVAKEGSHSSGHSGHDMMMHGMMGMMHGEHAMPTLAASSRIRSSVPIVTLGGVENSPYFAKALLENARSISIAPSRETIILAAHGLGDDAANEHWIGVLGNLTQQIKDQPGYNFKDIRFVTWREDWPDKKENGITQARQWVEEITKAGGRALVVPARVNGRGAADRYLEGLNFGWSQGFAQTPYFVQWFDSEVQKGIQQITVAQSHSGHENHAH